MTRLRARLRDESGQVLVFVAVILVGFVGMAGLVVDVGSWYQADRKLQTAADAAALAGAQELPLNQSLAKSTAELYAQHNYAGIPTPTVTFPDAATIDVVATTEAPGIFIPAFERILNSPTVHDFVTVHAEAQARVYAPSELKKVLPVAVHKDYACIVTNPGCFGQTVTMDFGLDDETDPTKSKFGLLHLDGSTGGGAGEIKKWLEPPYYTDLLSVDHDYPAGNGHKHGIENELTANVGRTLFVPIYDTASSTDYHVIGWAAFVIDEVVQPWKKDHHLLKGHFVTYIASDLAAGNPITDPNLNFGVKVITLTK